MGLKREWWSKLSFSFNRTDRPGRDAPGHSARGGHGNRGGKSGYSGRDGDRGVIVGDRGSGGQVRFFSF